MAHPIIETVRETGAGTFLNRTFAGLDGAEVAVWLRDHGYQVDWYRDTGRNGEAVTKCGIKVSTNGYVSVKERPMNADAISKAESREEIWSLLNENEQTCYAEYDEACLVEIEAWAERRNEASLYGHDDYGTIQTPRKPIWMRWMDLQFSRVDAPPAPTVADTELEPDWCPF